MHKFYKVVFGPVHFKTRFLPLLKTNPNTLNQYVFFVTHYELYEPYKDIVEIVDLDNLRKNDTWSVENEKFFPESDYNQYIHRTLTSEYCIPKHIHRFIFLWFKEKGIKKFTYLANNFHVTDNLEFLQKFVDEIEDDTFYLHTNFPMTVTPKVPVEKKKRNKMREKFPNLEIGNEYWWHEWKGQVFSFNSLEDVQLFFELWDEIAHLGGELSNNCFELNHGYEKIDVVTGWIFRILEVNRGYKIDYFPYQTGGNIGVGRHLSVPFDQFYVKNGNPDWNFRPYQEGDTLESYLELHQDEIKHYLTHHFNNLNVTYEGFLPIFQYSF